MSQRKLFFNGFLDETVKALLMCDGIYGSSSMNIGVFESDIQAPFIGGFRSSSLFLAEPKVIINGTMKIGDKFRCVGSLIGDQ
jgi:hypothetical protein